MTAFLALTSAAIIGGVDFFGGLISRRLPPVRVAALVQVAGLLFAIPAAFLVRLGARHGGRCRVVARERRHGRARAGSVLHGPGARADQPGGPVTGAVGATIPVIWDFARGEIPGALAVCGIVLAIAAIVIVSLATGAPGGDDTRAILLGTVPASCSACSS